MYRREFNGQVLSFGHAGILYENSFVMYDRQTNSLWVHVTGTAKSGPLAGGKLTFMPSTVTTWGNWKASYPNTKVLPGYRRGGFMGSYSGIRNGRGLGLVVIDRFQAKLYPFHELIKQPAVNDSFNGRTILVHYSAKEGTATAWYRKLKERVLTFRLTNKKDRAGRLLLRDEETGSHWTWLTGEAVIGPLKGSRLEQMQYNPILNDRFKAFYPGAPIHAYGG